MAGCISDIVATFNRLFESQKEITKQKIALSSKQRLVASKVMKN